jgi:hypothetical protein
MFEDTSVKNSANATESPDFWNNNCNIAVFFPKFANCHPIKEPALGNEFHIPPGIM